MDDNEERIQRVLNEAKKRELEEKYGAHFQEESNLPPEIQAQWLHHIDEFERQFQQRKRTTVREFVGNPTVRPLAEVPPDELEAELNVLLDLLESQEIIIHFDCELSVEEAYRFVGEELLDVEMDDIRIEGMSHNFIYTELHPRNK